MGDTRYDRVSENKELFLETLEAGTSKHTAIFESFLAQEKALIFGSSWEKELAILIDLLKDDWKGKIIIAPHDISESNVRKIQFLLKEKAIKFTDFKNYKEEQVLILDTIGQLSTAYYYGNIACIGGGFSGNLHNILEPAVFGLPVLFGPKHSKFPEADQFTEEGIGFEFHDFVINFIHACTRLDPWTSEFFVIVIVIVICNALFDYLKIGRNRLQLFCIVRLSAF